jgi:hypothetical protein
MRDLRKEGGGVSATFWREAGGTYGVDDVASALRDMAGLRGARVARATSMDDGRRELTLSGLSNERGAGDAGRRDELVLNVDGLRRSSLVQEKHWASRAYLNSSPMDPGWKEGSCRVRSPC